MKVILAFLLLTAASLAHAEVIVNNLSQPTSDYFGPIGSDASTTNFLIGQEFTLPPGATPYQLNKVTLLLSPVSGGASITVSIWNAGPDNNPTNEIGVVATQSVATAGSIDFVPTTNLTLMPGIYYVVAAPATPADSGFVNWAYTKSTNWTGPGLLGGYADTSPGAWKNTNIFGFPQQLSVEATPVTASLAISQHTGVTALSWAASLTGFVVDSSTNLASSAWQYVTNAITAVAGNNILANKWNDPVRAFRLRQSFAAETLDQPTTDWDGPIGSDANPNDFLIGQEFTLPAGNYSLNKFTLRLNPYYGSGNITVSIWHAGPDNNPTNQIAVISSQLVTTETNVNFVPSAPITLPSGTYYVVASPTSSHDSGLVGWDWTISTAWTGFGTLGRLATTYNGPWQNNPLNLGPYQLSIQVTPIP